MPKEQQIIYCPVCDKQTTEISATICPVCGFEQRIYISSAIPPEEIQRIETARKRWEEALEREARVRELEAQLEEERRLKKIREEEEARQRQAVDARVG